MIDAGPLDNWDGLIAELRAAQHKMSRKNEHRLTLWKAEMALTAVQRELRERYRKVEPAHEITTT